MRLSTAAAAVLVSTAVTRFLRQNQYVVRRETGKE
jgi:hypothetical protein